MQLGETKLKGIEKLKSNPELNSSFGESKTAKKWKNKTMMWSDFLKMLSDPIRTQETLEEYKKMPKAKKDAIKDVGGYVGGFLKQGKRRADMVQTRSIVTLDADSPRGDLWEDVKLLFDGACAIHSTHSHTADKPRYRFFIPLSRPVTAEEYQPLARKMAEQVGMDNFDDTTYQPERLMFKPSHSFDAEYIFEYQDGPLVDPDKVLAEYPDWTDSSYWPESSHSHGIRVKEAKKKGDPTLKGGIIGAFCRTYDIQSAIEKFLPDVYEPTSKDDRYTYLEGSTSGGLVLYDDKFAYSHHGTDPVGDSLNNAFDLVRIHLFSNQDEDVKEGTPINKTPSFRAMSELANSDSVVKVELIKSKMSEAKNNFDDWSEEDTDWLAKLRLDTRKGILPSIYNGFLFLENDPVLKGAVGYNEFAQRKERLKKLPWTTASDTLEWTDNDTVMMRAYLDENRLFQTMEKNIQASLLQSSMKRRYHPVKDYIEREAWDGIERLESLFIDYLGVDDSEYSRAVTRKWLVAAVARIYVPGIKFEMVPVLSGAQGIGKSTVIKKLAPEFFTDSLNGLGSSKDDLHLLIGSWLIELAELAASKKTEVEKMKQFVSATGDKFRLAYGREMNTHKRTCVFIGTSNDDQYLKDKTGNRRFYPLPCDKDRQTKSPFDKTITELTPQLWAEAKHYFDKGEELHLSDELEKVAGAMQKEAELEDIAELVIYEYLEIEIPDNWYELSVTDRKDFIQAELKGQDKDTFMIPENMTYKKRMLVTSREILSEAFSRDINMSLDFRGGSEVRKIGLVMSNHPEWKKQAIRLPPDLKTVKGYRRL